MSITVFVTLVSAMSQDKKGTMLMVMRRKLLLHTGAISFILTIGAGYRYSNPLTGAKMVEHHIDAHDSFQEKIANENG